MILVGALIALAWLVLWVWGQSPYGRLLSHEHLGEVRIEDDALVLVVVAGWTLMTVAMMLPTSLPLVMLFRTLVRQRPDRTWLTVLLIAGYLSVWTLFGVVVHLNDWVLHKAVEQSAWLQANAWLLGAATLVLAGIYQFTPLKYLCLDKCRSPLSFIIEHWQGRHEQTQAFRLGAHHGIFCLGCCWALMLLMFAVGVGNIGWMLVLGVVMAIEKNMPWGRRLSMPLGAFLIAWGLATAIGSMRALG
jgi:predicted metal-binding membrane protein